MKVRKKMINLQQINDLISIRNYAINCANNGYVDKQTANYMSGLIHLIDKKISLLLMSDEFKEFVNYQDPKVLKAARDSSNIKSGLKL